MTTAEILRRLHAIDTALASVEGLRIEAVADRLGCDAKTVRRDVQTLRAMGFATVQIVTGPRGTGAVYSHRYRNRRKRMFTKFVSGT